MTTASLNKQKNNPDFVPGAKILAEHFLHHVSNMTNKEKFKYYVDVLEILSASIKGLKGKPAKLINPVPALDDLISLTSINSQLATLYYEHLIYLAKNDLFESNDYNNY